MNIDTERYKICHQCVLEGIVKHQMFANWIDEAIRNHYKWLNVWCYKMDDYGFAHRSEKRICTDCPYVLEHLVLVGESLEFVRPS